MLQYKRKLHCTAIAMSSRNCNVDLQLQLHLNCLCVASVHTPMLTKCIRTTMDAQPRPTTRALVASLRQYLRELTPEARGMVTVNKLRKVLACRLKCDELMVCRREIRRNLHDIVEMLQDDCTCEQRRLSALRASMRPADGKVDVNGTRKRIRLSMEAAAEFNRLVSSAHAVAEEARVAGGLPLSLWWRMEASSPPSPTSKDSPVDRAPASARTQLLNSDY
jgi:hypothetical protein